MGGEGSTRILWSGDGVWAIGEHVFTGVKVRFCVVEGDLDGVRPRSSSGFVSGGDMRLAIDGSRFILNESMAGRDDYDMKKRQRSEEEWRLL